MVVPSLMETVMELSSTPYTDMAPPYCDAVGRTCLSQLRVEAAAAAHSAIPPPKHKRRPTSLVVIDSNYNR